MIRKSLFFSMQVSVQKRYCTCNRFSKLTKFLHIFQAYSSQAKERVENPLFLSKLSFGVSQTGAVRSECNSIIKSYKDFNRERHKEEFLAKVNKQERKEFSQVAKNF